MKRLGILLICLLLLAGCASSDYKQAQTLMDTGDYAAAKELLDAIPKYRDAAELSEICRQELAYLEAERLFDGKDYEAALAGYTELGLFRGAMDRAAECRRYIDYAAAVKLTEKRLWAEAEVAFVSLGNFLDSPQQVVWCQCENVLPAIVNLIQNEEWAEAELNLADIPDEPKTRERVAELRNRSVYERNLQWIQFHYYDNDEFLAGLTDVVTEIGSCGDYKSAPYAASVLGALDMRDIAAFIDNSIEYRAQLSSAISLDDIFRIARSIEELSIDEQLKMMDLYRAFEPMALEDVKYELYPQYMRSVDAGDSLFNQCGAAANGKLLIYTYTNDTVFKDYRLAFSAMAALPDELRPASLDEVEYVLYISYGYSNDGKYTGGTQGIREHADMTLYSVPGKKTVKSYSRILGDPSPNSFTYYGSAPAYKSGGSPDISKVAENFLAVVKQVG